MNTDLEITLEFLDSPTEVDFYAVAGAPGRDGADGQDGADGHTPVITASKQGKVTTISVDGSAIAQIDDGADGATGAKGDKGDKGDPGQDGAKGDKGDTGAKGDKGDKGDTGAQGIQGIQGEKGETGAKGDKGDKGDTGATGAAGQDGHTPVKGTDYWTAADKAEIVEDVEEEIDIPAVASGAQVKAGSVSSAFIAPSVEDAASFFGLAKAAGDSTQSASSNTVGNYTEEAKAAIRRMLGIPNYIGELLYDETTTEDLTELIANTDLSGQPFEVTKLIAIFNAGLPTTGTRDSFYGVVYFKSNNGSNYQDSFPTLQYVVTTSPLMSKITITAYPNMPMEQTVINAVSDANTQNIISMSKQSIAKSITGIRIYQSGSTKSLIPAGSRLRVYGIRA